MSSDPVKRWQVLCLAENKLVEVYSPDTPTMCPNDHEDRSIDTTRVYLLETISNDRVEVIDSTYGQSQHTTLNMNISSGDPNSVTVHDFSWPIDIKVWKVYFVPGPEHVGDTVEVIIDPDRVIGTLQEEAEMGDTELYVNAEAFDDSNLMRGVEVVLDDTIDQENVGRLIGYDRDTMKMVVENPLTYDFAVGTKFAINSCMVKDAYIDRSLIPYPICEKGLWGLRIPANTLMRIIWKNSDGQTKDIHLAMEYNYQ